jgi:hypothetical protein
MVFFLLKKFYSKKKIFFIKKKIFKIINDKNNYLPIKNVSKYNKKSKLLRSSNGKLKINLNERQVSNGLEYIGKKANSISIKEPLLKVKEINKLIFDKKMIAIARKILGSNDIKLGYIKLGIFFHNKLPKNCINYFHTDDLSKKVNENKKVCKLSFSFLKSSEGVGEFGIIPIKKDKLKFYKQYFTKDYLEKNIRNKIIFPKVSLGDSVIFDPNNFYHTANKPKKFIRIMFYVEFLGPKNKILFQNVKISKSVYNKLDANKKKLCANYQIVN